MRLLLHARTSASILKENGNPKTPKTHGVNPGFLVSVFIQAEAADLRDRSEDMQSLASQKTPSIFPCPDMTVIPGMSVDAIIAVIFHDGSEINVGHLTIHSSPEDSRRAVCPRCFDISENPFPRGAKYFFVISSSKEGDIR
jgi:hypothetical protein